MRIGVVLGVVLLLPIVAFFGCKNQEAQELEREVLAQQGEVVSNGAGEPVVEDQPSGEVVAEQLRMEDMGQPEDASVGQEERVTTDPGVVPDAGAIPPEEVPDPVSTPAESVLPERPTGSGYEVQISAGTDRADAAYVVETYEKRGYKPYVSTSVVDGREVYRVRLGVFATYGEAEKVRQELAGKYSIEPWVAPAP